MEMTKTLSSSPVLYTLNLFWYEKGNESIVSVSTRGLANPIPGCAAISGIIRIINNGKVTKRMKLFDLWEYKGFQPKGGQIGWCLSQIVTRVTIPLLSVVFSI